MTEVHRVQLSVILATGLVAIGVLAAGVGFALLQSANVTPADPDAGETTTGAVHAAVLAASIGSFTIVGGATWLAVLEVRARKH